MADKIFLIALGHRARNGKDSVAEFIKQMEPNTIIYHFADPLKEEVMNKQRKHPLITRVKDGDKYWYSIWSHGNEYRTMAETDVPFLHKIFEDRRIDVYWGMDGDGNDEYKDSCMLQFWGTDWRRNEFDPDYWINKVEHYFFKNCYSKPFVGDVFFLLPDTRFENEVRWVWNMSNSNVGEEVASLYLKVVRYNEDGTPYYDPSRDKNHDSEVNLEGVAPNYLIEAESGEMGLLKQKTKEFLEYIKNSNLYEFPTI